MEFFMEVFRESCSILTNFEIDLELPKICAELANQDLSILTVEEEIIHFCSIYKYRLSQHLNQLAIDLQDFIT